MNNISVGWHLLGVAVIIALLIFVPDDHQSFSFVFGRETQQHRVRRRRDERAGFWFLVLPLGFLLAMYTQTGYDASAHTAEETRGAAKAAAQGVWRSDVLVCGDRLVRPARVPIRGDRRRRRQ